MVWTGMAPFRNARHIFQTLITIRGHMQLLVAHVTFQRIEQTDQKLSTAEIPINSEQIKICKFIFIEAC